MDGRLQMRFEIGRRNEYPPTRNTVDRGVGLSVMLVQPSVINKHSFATVAERMFVLIMFKQVLVILEVVTAVLTVRVTTALDIVFL